jgi:hypothetical protein
MEGFLYVFLEGSDDDRFFEVVVRPLLVRRYVHLQKIQYSGLTKRAVNGLIKTAKSSGAEYLYLRDINSAPCVNEKKQLEISRITELQSERIVIVRAEIESWYYAGLDSTDCRQLRIPDRPSTEDLTKEDFDKVVRKHFKSRIEAMLIMLDRFKTDVASDRNKSFRYLLERHC